jgi:hypothetical protein
MKNPIAHQLVPKIQSWEIDGLAAVMVSEKVAKIQGASRLASNTCDAAF